MPPGARRHLPPQSEVTGVSATQRRRTATPRERALGEHRAPRRAAECERPWGGGLGILGACEARGASRDAAVGSRDPLKTNCADSVLHVRRGRSLLRSGARRLGPLISGIWRRFGAGAGGEQLGPREGAWGSAWSSKGCVWPRGSGARGEPGQGYLDCCRLLTSQREEWCDFLVLQSRRGCPGLLQVAIESPYQK